jgi:hypothetical protein
MKAGKSDLECPGLPMNGFLDIKNAFQWGKPEAGEINHAIRLTVVSICSAGHHA